MGNTFDKKLQTIAAPGQFLYIPFAYMQGKCEFGLRSYTPVLNSAHSVLQHSIGDVSGRCMVSRLCDLPSTVHRLNVRNSLKNNGVQEIELEANSQILRSGISENSIFPKCSDVASGGRKLGMVCVVYPLFSS